MKKWRCAFDQQFVSNERWQEFMTVNIADPRVRLYAHAMRPDESAEYLFDKLESDFLDARNPFNMCITELRKNLVVDYHDQSRLSNCEDILSKIVEVCNRVTPSIATACTDFYKPIQELLSARFDDLKNFVLTHLVSGELYRLVYGMIRELNITMINKCRVLFATGNLSVETVSI
jgi:hypothetical protein